jgi:hypothetical protein
MKYSLAITALVATATVTAQASGATTPSNATAPKSAPTAKGKCRDTKDTASFPDPLKLFSPGSAVFPCDMGAPIPFGPIPTGCAKLEIITGKLFSADLARSLAG